MHIQYLQCLAVLICQIWKKFDKFPVGIFQRYTITIPYPSPLILIVKEGGGRVEPKSVDTTCQRNEPEWLGLTHSAKTQELGHTSCLGSWILDLGVILQWLNQQDRILFTQNHIYPTCLVYPCFWYPSFLFVLIDRNAQETQPVWCNFPSNVKRGGTIPFPWGLPNQPSLWNWTLSYNLKLSESDISKAPLVINMII